VDVAMMGTLYRRFVGSKLRKINGV